MVHIDLTQMRAGESGTIVSINGGRGMVVKLEALGLRPGVKITKTSGQLMHGPITVRIGTSQAAIGFGMARRIIIELESTRTQRTTKNG